MEFDPSGKFLRSAADNLFVTAHMVRIDAEGNIGTADRGSHVVLTLRPEGRVLLALGECGSSEMTCSILISPLTLHAAMINCACGHASTETLVATP